MGHLPGAVVVLDPPLVLSAMLLVCSVRAQPGLCCQPLATVLAGQQHSRLVATRGSEEDSPHAALQHARVARDPFTLFLLQP